MFYLLVCSVASAVLISALCSLSEAALYSVPVAYVKHLAESGLRTGRILNGFKDDISRPISVILILNTTANIAGASVAGWSAGEVFGESSLGWFTAGFTLIVLYVGEIVPKTFGSIYCKQVSRVVALPVFFLCKVFYPFLWFSEVLSSRFIPEQDEPTVSQEEVLSMAAMGAEEGAIGSLEGSVISNVIGLDQLLVKDILTPRVVVFRLEENTTVGDIEKEIHEWSYSRIPLYSEAEPDHLTSYVTQRDIYRYLLQGQRDKKMKEFSRTLGTVPELMTADKLLLLMFEKREHICAVVDEHGGLAGIITLEDIIEEVVGREIIDEYDAVSDLRTFASALRVGKTRKKTIPIKT